MQFSDMKFDIRIKLEVSLSFTPPSNKRLGFDSISSKAFVQYDTQTQEVNCVLFAFHEIFCKT